MLLEDKFIPIDLARFGRGIGTLHATEDVVYTELQH
jgi:hypothetical protein